MSAEQTFRINDEWFRELVDLAPVFIWIADPDGRCMYCNRARLEFTGRTMEQEMGDGWNECVHPDDLDNRMTAYKSVVAAQREFKVEYRLRRHDGEYRRVLAHGVPRVAETGELLRYVGSCIDVTDRKRAEAEIQARLRQQGAIVEIVQNLALARTLEDVTGIVRKGVREMLGADGATFVVREGDEVHYIDEDAIGKLWKGQRFPIGECISGWAMLNRRPAVVEDIHNDPRIPIPAYESTFVKSLIMAPVRSTDPVASIGAYWATARSFSQDEVDCLQAVADSAAVALTNNDLITALERDRAHRYLDIVPHLIVALDREGRITMINKTGCRLLGYDEPELIGKDWFRTCLPRHVGATVGERFRGIMAGERLISDYYENPVLTRQGSERLIGWHNTVLRDESGAIVGTLSSGEDITERRRAEGDARRQQEILQRIFDNVPVMITFIDQSGQHVLVNRQWEQTLESVQK